VIKTIPRRKKCKKAKCFSEEALQILEKKREAKGKGEKERYNSLNSCHLFLILFASLRSIPFLSFFVPIFS